jgi:hypothetical protein
MFSKITVLFKILASITNDASQTSSTSSELLQPGALSWISIMPFGLAR